MTAPQLSVGLPVYNGAGYLRSALESIITQDFQDFELIISDNASNDETSVICRQYADRDARIRYYRSDSNQGGSRNLNRVFELARGEYFKWAAHDDICLPGFFSRCLEIFDSAPSTVVLVYPRTQMIDDLGHPLRWYTECLETKHRRPHERLSHVLHKFWALCPQYGVIRSDALRKTRLYGRFIGNDFVLLAELAMLGEFWEVPEVLFQRRIHAAMSTKANRRRSDLLRWVDPSSTAYGAFIPPTMRLGYEYVRSIRQLPLTTRDRWLCYITAPAVWYTRELRNWSGRQKSRLFNGIGSRAPK